MRLLSGIVALGLVSGTSRADSVQVLDAWTRADHVWAEASRLGAARAPELTQAPERAPSPAPEPPPGPAPPPTPEPPAPTPELAAPAVPTSALEGDAPLSLLGALELALGNNPQLRVSRFEPEIAQAAVDRERAGWDPRLQAEVSREDVREPATSIFDGIQTRESDDRNLEVRVVRPDRSGGSLEAGVLLSRAATNSRRAIINPTYRSGLTVRYARPLLAGAGRDATRRGLGLAEADLRVARWELRDEVLQTLAATERAYWDLAAAREQVDVAQLNLAAAEALRERSEHRADAGVLAGVAVVEAEAAVAERRDLLLVAERAEQVAHNALVALIDPPPRPGFYLGGLSDVPGQALPEIPAVQNLVAQSLLNAPAYRAALARLQARRVELAFSRDATQPRLDVVASLTANGVSSGRYRGVRQSLSGDFPGYFLGLQLDWPLGRRAARAERRRRSLELEQALRAVKALELELEGSVTDLVQRFRTDLLRVQVSGRRVEAARDKVAAEEQRFNGGLITADDVLRFQAELAAARGAEVGARAQASVSGMEIFRVAGTLLARRGVEVDVDGLLLDPGS